jgi:hypothetical protein
MHIAIATHTSRFPGDDVNLGLSSCNLRPRFLLQLRLDNQLSADSFHMKETSPFSDMFPVNSYVLLKPPDGAREKLRLPKAGPYIVVGISGDKYSIQDLLTHKVTDIHVSNLCEFRHDSSSSMDPTEVAARNAGNSLSTGSLNTGAKHQSTLPWNS